MTTPTSNNTIPTSTPLGKGCGTPTQYKLPLKDASCGIPNNPKYAPLLEICAQPAKVQTYDHDCALYAPALHQSVQNLTDCLYDAGVGWEDVWCFGSINATATVTGYPTATVTATATTRRSTTRTKTATDGVDERTSTTGSTSSTGTVPSTTAPSYDNGVVGFGPGDLTFSTKIGLVLLNLVFSWLVFGV